MPEIDTIITRFETDARQAVSETQALRQAEEELRNAQDATGAAHQRSGGFLDVFRQKLVEHRLEETQTTRATRAFALELGGFLPAQADIAAQALGAFAAGGVIGIGIEGLKLAIEKVSEAAQRNSHFSEMMARGHAEAAAESTKAWDAFFKHRADQERTEAERLNRDSKERTRKEMQDELNAAAALLKERARIEKENDYGYDYQGKADKLKEIDKLLEDSKIRQRGITARAEHEEEVFGMAHAKEIEDEQKKSHDKRVQEEQRYQDAAQRIRMGAMSEEDRENARFALEMAGIRAGDFATRKAAEETHEANLRRIHTQDETEEAAHWQRKADLVHRQEKVLHDEAIASKQDEVNQMKRLGELLLRQTQAQYDMERAAIEEIRSQWKSLGQTVVSDFSAPVVNAFGDAIDSCRAYDVALANMGDTSKRTADFSAAAMEKMLQDALTSIAKQAATKALFEGAEALASLAVGNVPGAELHGAAALEFGLIAGAAGGSAYLIGQNRGLTASEATDVASHAAKQAQSGYASASKGGREAGYGGRGGQSAAGGPTVQVFFSGNALLTKAEVAANLEQLQNYLAGMR